MCSVGESSLPNELHHRYVNVIFTVIAAEYLISEMYKESIEPDEYDEDLLLTPDVRDLMEMEV